MNQIRFKSFLVFLILFLLNSCKDNFSNDANTGALSFDIERANEKLEHSETEERWAYAVHVLQQNYKNYDAIQNWLMTNEALFFESFHAVNHEVVDTLLYNCYDNKFEEVTAAFAKKTQLINPKTPKSSICLRATLLSYHYSDFNNLDSLKIQLNLIEPEIENELPYWIQLAYYSNLGLYYGKSNKYLEGIVNLNTALAMVEDSDTTNRIVIALNLSGQYMSMRYYEKAKTLLDNIIEDYGLERIPKDLMNNCALVYSKNGEFGKAESIFEESIKFFQKKNDSVSLATLYGNFGNMKRRQKDYNQALYLIAKSDSICLALDLTFGRWINGINEAEVYFDKGDFDFANKKLISLQSSIENQTNNKMKRDFYELFYRICDSLKEHQQANVYFRNYAELKQEIEGDNTRSAINEWELSIEREQRLSLESINAKLKAEQQLIYIFFISMAIVLILVTGLIFFKQKNKTMKLVFDAKQKELEMELKSKELLVESVRNISVTQAKSEIFQFLENISETSNLEEYRRCFQKVQQKVKEIGGDSAIVEFQKRFVTIHQNFYDELKQKASDLTQNEILICAMIKLNYNSKEIAFMSNRTVRTIENNRSAIRKKLKLDSSNSLQDFIQSL